MYLDNKRFYSLDSFFKQKFHTKVIKVGLNANFSCPNFKNGTGCIYCKHGSGNYLEKLSLKEQFNILKIPLDKKWKNAKYIAYLQANTNTYAPLATLKKIYKECLDIPNVIGLAIATRSDALNKEILDYLAELNKKTFLMVELGLQSAHLKTLEYINRGHDLNNFKNAVLELKKRNIFTTIHIINGLPYETKEMMLETIKFINSLKVDGIKFHMLYIAKDTPILTKYQEEHFSLLTEEEYIDIVCTQLRYLDPSIVVMRLMSNPNRSDLVEPLWLLNRKQVLNNINKEMQKRNIYQGDLFN